VIPKSHLLFEDFFKTRPQFSRYKDFIPMSHDKELWDIIRTKNLPLLKVSCEPGDFVVWDSRTIHNNTPSTDDNKNIFNSHDFFSSTSTPHEVTCQQFQLSRLVAFVCMSPLKMITSEIQLQKRYNAFINGLTSTHWPVDCITNESQNEIMNEDWKVLNLNELQKRLVPFPEYWPENFKFNEQIRK